MWFVTSQKWGLCTMPGVSLEISTPPSPIHWTFRPSLVAIWNTWSLARGCAQRQAIPQSLYEFLDLKRLTNEATILRRAHSSPHRLLVVGASQHDFQARPGFRRQRGHI